MMKQLLSDSELLHEYAIAGSQEAFEELVRRHTGFVYAAARRQAGEQAEDVMQAVFILLARKAKALMKQKNLAGWLFLATRNVARNALRSERRRKAYEHAAAEQAKSVVEQEWPSLEEPLDHVLVKLGAGERDVLLLRFFKQMRFDEIAATLGTTEAAARVRVSRAVQSLRKKLGTGEGVMGAAAIEAMLAAHGQSAAPASALAAAVKVAGAVKSGTTASMPASALLRGMWIMASMQTKVTAAVVVGIILAGSGAAYEVMKSRPVEQAEAPKLKTILYEARVDDSAKWDRPAMPPDLKPVKEQFTRHKTPDGQSATFKGRVEGVKTFDGVDVGIITMRGVQWTSSSNYQWQPVNKDGTFSITAIRYPDQRRALAVRPKGEPATFLRTEFEADESADDIVLRAKPTKQMLITAKDAKGRPVSWFQVEEYDGYTVQDDDGNNLEMQRTDAPKGSNGKLKLAMPLEPVAVYLGGTGMAPLYRIVDPRQADAFEFKMLSAAKIEGTVTRDGKPVAGAVIFLINDAAPLSAAYRRTDKDGHYVWPNGVPGTYRVNLKNQQMTVDVGPGETGKVDFELNEPSATQAAQ